MSVEENPTDTSQHQLPQRATPRGCLLLELPVKGGWNVHGGPNRVSLHILIMPYKYGTHFLKLFSAATKLQISRDEPFY
ncbi:MAG TPA: hypothetical protein VJO35_02620 [Terriglobales bacterium]|nr:hypothetical protein [Terriglobales bacterium]